MKKKAKGLYAEHTFSLAVRIVNFQKAKEIIGKRARILKARTYESPYYEDGNFVFECDIEDALAIRNEIDVIEVEASNAGHKFMKD
jgi:hypothetical protein